MTIRTITVLHGYYTALQGYWDWNKSKGFVFVSHPRPDQSPSRTASGQDTPAPQVPYNTPSGPGSSIAQAANDSCDSLTMEITNDLNNPDDDTEPSSLDSSLCSIEFEPPSKLQCSQDNCGLGISGLLKKDGSGPFTGLGIVSVHSSSWRHIPLSPVIVSASGGTRDVQDETRSSWDVSETMLQETLMTFNEGSFLGHALESIPECESWYSTEPIATTSPQPSSTIISNLSHSPQVISSPDRPRVGRSAGRRVILTRDLTLPTISSELRRILGPRNDTLFPGVSRSRSCLYAPDSALSANRILPSGLKARRSVSDPSLAKNLRVACSESPGCKERAYIRRRAVSTSEGRVGMPRGGLGLACVGGRTLPRWR